MGRLSDTPKRSNDLFGEQAVIDKMYWAAADALSLGSQLGLAQALPAGRRSCSAASRGCSTRWRVVAATSASPTRTSTTLATPSPPSSTSRWCAPSGPVAPSGSRTRCRWSTSTENTAGEGFFTRMTALQAQPQRAHRPRDLLLVSRARLPGEVRGRRHRRRSRPRSPPTSAPSSLARSPRQRGDQPARRAQRGRRHARATRAPHRRPQPRLLRPGSARLHRS